jgi:aspartyl/asparaginyl beta-hydroxylase (cupin superfamily)
VNSNTGSFEDFLALIERADRAMADGQLKDASEALLIASRNAAANVDTWLKFSAVLRALSDDAGALEAVESALRCEPLNFVALLLYATLLEKLGRPEADECFGHALAQCPKSPIAPQMQKMVDHASVRYLAWQQRTNDVLNAALDALHLPPSAATHRLVRFGTNTTRLTRSYHSEPSDYHYPGLPEIEFYECSLFAWLASLESLTEEITREFHKCVSAERNELVPYVKYAEGQPVRQWAELNNSLDWSAIHLIRNGKPVAINVQHCPKTMALLASLPQPHIVGASPNAMFSLLAPGAKIPPHTGVANTRLICHLPIVVPGDCWFRVGSERRIWQHGKAWVFDDTIEHEAANESASLRVVLIFDVWHPALSADERAGVSAIVGANEGRIRVDF